MAVRVHLRYLDLPTSGWGAFMAVPVENPASYNAGQNKITATMGNVPVPSPRPASMQDNSWGAELQPSGVAPNWFLPVTYVARMNKWLVTIQRRFVDIPMPIPAVAFNQAQVVNQLKARIGGRTATPSVRPTVSWPTYGAR